ncbi:MAG: hypothetical protein CMJ40_03745 [Phycisphaerae bacterium]|nr:hypothetical protein [Phycisphaerae bacterium]|tara:strand:- start:1766 stop:2896 length:1131 start_codon:yes stop_codon:yes gene_type:complete
MNYRMFHGLNAICLMILMTAGCQSQTRPETAEKAFVGPPTLESVSSESELASGSESSEAEAIAARARQDLLDSLAMNAGDPHVMDTGTTSASGTPPLVVWNEPGSDPIPETDDREISDQASSLQFRATAALPAKSVSGLADELARALQERSRRGRTPMRDLTVMAALAMLDKNRTVHPETVESLTDEQRVALVALQQWFLVMEHGMDDQEATLEMLTETIQGLQASLKQKPSFGLAQQSLVTRVGGFGDVDEWALRSEHDEYNFIAHSGQEIILYMELEGFDSRLDSKGQWETATSQELVIYSDRDGIPVWRESWQTATDRSRTRRSDYFTAQKVTIPTNLSVGKYQLKVRVRDEQTQAESEATIPFVMTAAAMSP